MKIEEKKKLVKQLKEDLKEAKSALFVDYSGLGAGALDELRGELLEADSSFQVVKNSLLLRALEQMSNGPSADGCQMENSSLAGPTALILSFEDALRGIKIVSEYKDEVGSLDFKGGIFEKELINSEEALELAEISGREALLVQFALLAQAPLQRLIATANAPLQRFNADLKTLSKQE